MGLKPSELILNSDGSIYHLNLKPKQIANTIITVGDPDRVEKVTQHFDSIEHRVQNREFTTHTGYYYNQHITVISTGIGSGNIDIVLHELDALVNIDFETKTLKKNLTKLNIIRIGTSGALQADIPLDSFLLSTHGISLDGLLHFYANNAKDSSDIEDAFVKQTKWASNRAYPTIIKASETLMSFFDIETIQKGMTYTASGFYGPQARQLRLPLNDTLWLKKLQQFSFKHYKITNLEMETAAIYGLSKRLGHNAVSLNAILANRCTGVFSEHPERTVEKLISFTLNRLASKDI